MTFTTRRIRYGFGHLKTEMKAASNPALDDVTAANLPVPIVDQVENSEVQFTLGPQQLELVAQA